MSTPFMFLDLPTPSVTLGPEWASQLNVALTAVDDHDHTNGKGRQIPTIGININADLNFNNYSAFGLTSIKLATQPSFLLGPTNVQSLWSYSGDLYYTASTGTQVRITNGASLAAVPSDVVGMDFSIISSDSVIPSSGSTVLYNVDTTAPRAITLPSPSAVAPGRLFIFKDRDGLSETNPITIVTTIGTIDNQYDNLLNNPLVFASGYGSIMLASDGNTNWLII
jgi:hypothetical protein